MSGDNAALSGVNEKPMMDRQNHHGNDNVISGVVKDDGNNMNMRNVHIMSSHNNLNSVGTSANNFTSMPPRFVSKNVRLPSLGSPRMNHRMRSRRFDGETVPLTQILQALPMKVVVMGFGLLVILLTSFMHVILIEREHLEGHHLHPMSNVIRSASNDFGINISHMLHLRSNYSPVKRRTDDEDLPSVLIRLGLDVQNSAAGGVDETNQSTNKYHRLIRRKLDEKVPKDDSFPVLKFQPMAYVPDDEPKHGNGGLKINRVKNFKEGRLVKEDKNAISGHVWDRENMNDDEKSKYVDSYYAFDDDIVRSRHFHNEDCKRTSWHKYYFPTCNNFHEIDLLHDSSKKLGGGYYRTVWSSQDSLSNSYVLKGSKYKHPGTFIKRFWRTQVYDKYCIYINIFDFGLAKTDFFEFTRMDALVMERLTSSSRVVDIFGHCALAVATEKLDYDVEDAIIPTSGHPNEKHGLQDKYGVRPQNDYNPTEKLELALEMALCIAELHGFKDGVIVHDDIQLSQFLIGSDGKLKLNDFNRAEIMLYNDKKGEYCKYKNGGVYGNYRAPEEFSNYRLDEKIDVWSMGNNLYALLTGLWVYYEIDDDKAIHKKAIDGELSYIDPRYETNSFAEGKIVEILKRCWVYDVKYRADIFEVVEFLEAAVEENKQREQSLSLS